MGTITVGLGALFVALFGGSLLLRKSSKDGTLNNIFQSSDSVIANDASFAEQYQADSVITSESEQPYISSNEQSRPEEEKKSTIFSSWKDKYEETGSFFPFKLPDLGTVGTFYVGYKAGDVLGDIGETDGEKVFDFLTLALVLAGGYVVYKVLK